MHIADYRKISLLRETVEYLLQLRELLFEGLNKKFNLRSAHCLEGQQKIGPKEHISARFPFLLSDIDYLNEKCTVIQSPRSLDKHSDWYNGRNPFKRLRRWKAQYALQFLPEEELQMAHSAVSRMLQEPLEKIIASSLAHYPSDAFFYYFDSLPSAVIVKPPTIARVEGALHHLLKNGRTFLAVRFVYIPTVEGATPNPLNFSLFLPRACDIQKVLKRFQVEVFLEKSDDTVESRTNGYFREGHTYHFSSPHYQWGDNAHAQIDKLEDFYQTPRSTVQTRIGSLGGNE